MENKIKRYNISLHWLLRISILIAAAMIIFGAIAPWLINTETVKQKIISEFLKKAGLELKFQEISLAFLPLPQVTVTQGRVTRPETFTANWISLSVAPKLLALLTGDVQISRLSIQTPEVDVALPETVAPTDDGRTPTVAGIIQEAIAPVVGPITAMGKDFDMVIANGRLTITLRDKTDLRFTGIDAHLDLPVDTLNIDLQSKADFFEKMELTAVIDLNAMQSRGQIDLFQLKPQRMPAGLIPAGNVEIGDAPIDLRLTFNTDRFDVVDAELQGTLPMLTARRGGNQITVNGQAFTGQFHQDNQGTTVTLAELKLDQPQLSLGGTFFWDQQGGKMKVDLTGRDVDIPSTRQAALKLAGDIAVVSDIFDIVKGGQIPAIRFSAHGNSISDLGTLENMTLTANLLQGEIFVPGVELNTTAVSADVTLAHGMLETSRMTARYGETRVTDGTLRLGFSGEKTPFHLDIGLDGDLSQVSPVLKRVVDDKRFIEELDRIRNPSGRATGRLILGETLDAIHTRLTVSDFSLSAQVPYLLELEGRDIAYSGTSVTFKHLNGRIEDPESSGDDTALFWQKVAVILRRPLAVANGRFSWGQKGKTAFSGDLTAQDDLNLSVDVSLAPETINIKKLVIKDNLSHAAVGLTYHENKDVTFSFNGNLENATMDKLLATNQTAPGGIKGDLHWEYFNDHPLKSKFEGHLSATDLGLLRHFKIPVTVNRLSVNGLKDNLHLESDVLFQQDDHFSLKGDVNFSPKGIVFDADLSSSGIALDRVATAWPGNRETDDGLQHTDIPKTTFWDFPIEGVVRLKADQVTYDNYTWRPLGGTISLHPEKIDLAIGDAALCGIATPGTVTLSPGKVALDFKLAAQDQDIDTSVTCMWDQTAKIVGRFDLTGEIKGQGPPQDLLAWLSGNIEFNATDGTIYAGRAFRDLRNILKLVNITEIYRGKLPELQKEGFAYHAMKSKMKIKNNSFIFEEGLIDGHALGIVYKGVITLADNKIDGTGLVAPLKTVDSIVKHIPLVDYLSGGSLVSIPISMKGDINNPQFDILPAEAVGQGLAGVMERTLDLPVKILDSIDPENK